MTSNRKTTASKNSLAVNRHRFDVLEQQLRDLPQPQRSSAARAAGLRLLQEHMQTRSGLAWFGIRPWLVAGSAACAVLLVVGGAQFSLPNDFLYGVKRTSEYALVSVTADNSVQAEQCSWLMKRRANELAALSSADTNTIEALTTSIVEEAVEFQQLIKKENNDSRLISLRNRDTAYVISVLSEVSPRLKDSEQRGLVAKTIATLESIRT